MSKKEGLPRPIYMPAGEMLYLPKKWGENNDERGIIARIIVDKVFFGTCYRQLCPEFFEDKNYKGVAVSFLVLSHEVDKSLTYPGDIDMLVVPYTEQGLSFHKSMAIEVKVIRAGFAKQGKSPNQYGFSQAQALYDFGMPYTAVAHMIVCDTSPVYHWRKFLVGTYNAEKETLENLKEVYRDDLPLILMDRALGRLQHNRKNENIGLLVGHMPEIKRPKGMATLGEPSKINPNIKPDLVYKLIEFYRENHRSFMDIPKEPPAHIKKSTSL